MDFDVLSANAKSARERMGLSFREAAKVTGVSASTIHKVEAGTLKDASTRTLMTLANGYGTTVGYLLGECDELTEDERLKRKIAKLSKRDILAVIHLADWYLDNPRKEHEL